MPVPVNLDFIKPDSPNYVKLRIFESADELGPFNMIEEVVVAYPDYPTRYTTILANNADDWFEIEWVDAQGAKSPRSNAMKGGTENLVGKITNRVLMRDPTLKEEVVAQEAEGVIAEFFGGTVDPYSVALTANYKQLTGLTYVTLARTYTSSIMSGGDFDSFTAGLISMKSGTGAKTKDGIAFLLKEGMRLLGLGRSVVAQMATPVLAGGMAEIVSADLSRLIIEVE